MREDSKEDCEEDYEEDCIKDREEGYEEPFVHFATGESPPFLHAAVRSHLGLAAHDHQESNLIFQEKP